MLTGLNLGEPLVLRARSRFGWGRAVREMIEDVAELGAGGAPELADPSDQGVARLGADGNPELADPSDQGEPPVAWRPAKADT